MDEIVCRICERQYDGSQHFGVEICRACAAFFRRSVENNKPFVCRREGDCKLDVPRKEACQMCRYQRCLDIGITPEMVINKTRKSNTKPSMAPPTKELKYSGRTSDQFSPPSTSSVKVEVFGIIRPIATTFPTISNLDSQPASIPLLRKLVERYRNFCKSKMEFELALEGVGETEFVSMGRNISLVTLDRLSKIMEEAGRLLDRWVLECFPEVADYQKDHKNKIVSCFVMVMWELDNCYWTYRLMAKDERSKKLMTSQCTYVDLERPDKLLDPDVKRTPAQSKGMTEMVTRLIEQQLCSTLPSLHSLQLTELEFVALMAIAFWSIGQSYADEHFEMDNTEAVSIYYRDTIFAELESMIRAQHGEDECVNRLGKIMLLYSEIQLNTTAVRENILLQRVMNAFTRDSYVSTFGR